jgi:hypothetical protein
MDATRNMNMNTNVAASDYSAQLPPTPIMMQHGKQHGQQPTAQQMEAQKQLMQQWDQYLQKSAQYNVNLPETDDDITMRFDADDTSHLQREVMQKEATVYMPAPAPWEQQEAAPKSGRKHPGSAKMKRKPSSAKSANGGGSGGNGGGNSTELEMLKEALAADEDFFETHVKDVPRLQDRPPFFPYGYRNTKPSRDDFFMVSHNSNPVDEEHTYPFAVARPVLMRNYENMLKTKFRAAQRANGEKEVRSPLTYQQQLQRRRGGAGRVASSQESAHQDRERVMESQPVSQPAQRNPPLAPAVETRRDRTPPGPESDPATKAATGGDGAQPVSWAFPVTSVVPNPLPEEPSTPSNPLGQVDEDESPSTQRYPWEAMQGMPENPSVPISGNEMVERDIRRIQGQMPQPPGVSYVIPPPGAPHPHQCNHNWHDWQSPQLVVDSDRLTCSMCLTVPKPYGLPEFHPYETVENNPKFYKFFPPQYTTRIRPAGRESSPSEPIRDCFHMFA